MSPLQGLEFLWTVDTGRCSGLSCFSLSGMESKSERAMHPSTLEQAVSSNDLYNRSLAVFNPNNWERIGTLNLLIGTPIS